MKAFHPARLPFPVMHVDTGHNFPEVLEFRDRRVEELGERLIVASVQESIDKGRVREEPGNPSRNRLQTTTLLDAILEAKRIKKRGALRRQKQYIGKLMGRIDPEPIRVALQRLRKTK